MTLTVKTFRVLLLRLQRSAFKFPNNFENKIGHTTMDNFFLFLGGTGF
jgi:hypothetical protein